MTALMTIDPKIKEVVIMNQRFWTVYLERVFMADPVS
jgi:hypothetical protein